MSVNIIVDSTSHPPLRLKKKPMDVPVPSSTVQTQMVSSSISASGIIENTKHMGYDTMSCIKELIDGSLDAGAQCVHVLLDTVSKTLYIVDDGFGMDKVSLKESLYFHHSQRGRDAARIGLYGLGENAAHIVLSDTNKSTHTISKTPTGELCEVEADWPDAIANNRWELKATDITVARQAIWTKHNINPSKGTIKIIPMKDASFHQLMSDRSKLLAEIGYAYEAYIASGRVIKLYIDGSSVSSIDSFALGYDKVEDVNRNSIKLEVWKKGDDLRIYFMHTSKSPSYTEMVREDGTSDSKLRDYEETKKAGFVCDGKFTLKSVYNPIWNPPKQEGHPRSLIDGYTSFRRGDRALDRLPHPPSNGAGDYELRRYRASARHELSFTKDEDHLIGVEVNKSRINPQNINGPLLAKIRKLTTNWIDAKYNRMKKAAAADGTPAVDDGPGEVVQFRRNPELTRLIKRIRAIAASHAEFINDLNTHLDEYESGDED